MRLGQADLRIRAVDVFAHHHERADARDIGLERQHLQIEHQLDVFPERRGHADRLVRHREIAVVGFGLGDAVFEVAHGVEIFAQIGPVPRSEPPVQPRDLLRQTVKNAAIFIDAGLAFFRGGADAEQPLEHEARVRFGRQRRRRVLLRQRVHVGARIPVVAGADDIVAVDGASSDCSFVSRQIRPAMI
jgi:hypothetical protein